MPIFTIRSRLREHASIANMLDKEEFSGMRTVAGKVGLALNRLEEQRSAQFRNRQRYLTAEDRADKAQAELAAIHAKRKAAGDKGRAAQQARAAAKKAANGSARA